MSVAIFQSVLAAIWNDEAIQIVFMTTAAAVQNGSDFPTQKLLFSLNLVLPRESHTLFSPAAGRADKLWLNYVFLNGPNPASFAFILVLFSTQWQT